MSAALYIPCPDPRTAKLTRIRRRTLELLRIEAMETKTDRKQREQNERAQS